MIAYRPRLAEQNAPAAHGGASSEAKPITQRIVEYIDQNYARPISLRDVADAFGYSPCHLTHIFSQSTGIPITAWIIRRRILAARQLLGELNVDVATACETAGFNDLCYFTRQFVRHVGMTPGRYRSTMNGGSRAKKETSTPAL